MQTKNIVQKERAVIQFELKGVNKQELISSFIEQIDKAPPFVELVSANVNLLLTTSIKPRPVVINLHIDKLIEKIDISTSPDISSEGLQQITMKLTECIRKTVMKSLAVQIMKSHTETDEDRDMLNKALKIANFTPNYK